MYNPFVVFYLSKEQMEYLLAMKESLGAFETEEQANIAIKEEIENLDGFSDDPKDYLIMRNYSYCESIITGDE